MKVKITQCNMFTYADLDYSAIGVFSANDKLCVNLYRVDQHQEIVVESGVLLSYMPVLPQHKNLVLNALKQSGSMQVGFIYLNSATVKQDSFELEPFIHEWLDSLK